MMLIKLPISLFEIIAVAILFTICMAIAVFSFDEDYAVQTVLNFGLVTGANIALLIVTRWPTQIRDRLMACLVDLCMCGTFGLMILVSLLLAIRAVSTKMSPFNFVASIFYVGQDLNVEPILGILLIFLISLIVNMLILFQIHNFDKQTVAKCYLWATSILVTLFFESIAALTILVWIEG